MVAAPGLVGGDVEEFYALGRAVFEEFADLFFLCGAIHIDADRFGFGECLRHANEGGDHAR